MMNKGFVVGVIFFICMILILIVFFSSLIWPIEYTNNALDSAYKNISVQQGFNDYDHMHNMMVYLTWAFVGCIAVPIFLLFVYLYALAHKDEYDVGK
jgi:hypothetical protein